MSTFFRSQMIQALAAHPRGFRKTILQKGFTLVELMVVIVIVGILSAVALPRFLGVKDKAQINTQLGEAAGLAKECSAAIISEGPYPDAYDTLLTNSGLTISGNCNDGTTASAPAAPVTFTTVAAKSDPGTKCGITALGVPVMLTTGDRCQVSVNNLTGVVTYVVV